MKDQKVKQKDLIKFLDKITILSENSGIRKYFFNTSWLLLEKLLRIISGLFIGVFIARYLGPEKFGLYSYVLAFTFIFAGVSQLGLGGILVRELINNPDHRNIYLGTSFWLRIIGALIVISIISFILHFSNEDLDTKILIYIISAGLVFQSFEVIEYHFESQVLSKVTSICKIIQLLISSIVKICLVLIKAELVFFAVVITFDVFSLAVSYLIAYKIKNYKAFYRYFNLNIAKKLLKSSWPLILSTVFITIYMRVDQIMIKEMLGEKETGIYSVSVRISESFYFIPVVISASLFPAILNAKKNNAKVYNLRLQRIFDLMVLIALAISLIMTFCVDWLIIFLFGPEYQEASRIVIIQIWASIFVFLGVTTDKWFIAENQEMISFWRTFIGMVTNVSLNFFLIPIYGLKGAAFATLISQIIVTYILDYFTKKTKLIFIMKTKSLTLSNYIYSKK